VAELRLALVMNMKCECGEADLCTDHVIGHCRLFDQLRYEAQKGCITPPIFTKELVLDKI
jgi:hypothetical protein